MPADATGFTCESVLRGCTLLTSVAEDYRPSFLALASCVSGKKVLFISLARSPKSVVEWLAHSGVPSPSIVFISSFDSGLSRDACMPLEEQCNLTEISLMITKAVGTRQPDLVVLDSLNVMLSIYDETTVLRFVQFTRNKLALTETPSLFVVREGVDPAFIPNARPFFDSVIDGRR